MSGADFGFVGVGVEECVDFVGVDGFDFDDPTFAVGVVVDGGGVFEVFVEFDDFGFDGHEEVCDGFDGFDGAEGFTGGDSVAFAVDVDEYDVAEFVLCIVSDADIGEFAFGAYPFVVLGVLEICGNVHKVLKFKD